MKMVPLLVLFQEFSGMPPVSVCFLSIHFSICLWSHFLWFISFLLFSASSLMRSTAIVLLSLIVIASNAFAFAFALVSAVLALGGFITFDTVSGV